MIMTFDKNGIFGFMSQTGREEDLALISGNWDGNMMKFCKYTKFNQFYEGVKRFTGKIRVEGGRNHLTIHSQDNE